MFDNRSPSLRVGVDAMVFSRSLAINLYTEPGWLSIPGGAEHQVDIARLEAQHDRSGNGIERGHLRLVVPVSGKPPLVEFQMLGDRVRMSSVFHEAARREEVVC